MDGPGQIVENQGPSNYRVDTEQVDIVHHHIDQIIKIRENNENENLEVEERENLDIGKVETDSGSHRNLDQVPEDVIEIPSSENQNRMLKK